MGSGGGAAPLSPPTPHGPPLQALQLGQTRTEWTPGLRNLGGGKGEESLKGAWPHTAGGGSPRPQPSGALQIKRCKGPGQVAQVEEEERGCTQGSRPLLTSGLITQKPCRENKRKREKKGRGKKREVMRVLHQPQQLRGHHKGPPGAERKPRRLSPPSLLQHLRHAPPTCLRAPHPTLWLSERAPGQRRC